MDRYESLGVVGEGSYGLVLRCRHRETGQIVAIKKFLESEEDHSVKKIAMREVRMLKRLRHENLINLIEFFRRKRRLYLVFEYVDHTILDELEQREHGLEEAISRNHIFQVLRGIAFCHENQIIHRDVKPENVLVSRLGVVKLCDFGFARLLGGPGESCTDYVATRWYRAPELLVGDTKYGREVDVWAVGCLLAEMLSGEPLFPGESDIDQLFHIIKTLGELSIQHKLLIEKNPMLSGLRLPEAASSPLSSSFPTWSSRTLGFVSACLNLSPGGRPTAHKLLEHEYFMHDNFPDNFLPLLRQKVQQEFSNNVLLQGQPNLGRRGSGHGDKKNKKSKAGAVSPEGIQGKMFTKTSTLNPSTPKTDMSTNKSSPTKMLQNLQYQQPSIGGGAAPKSTSTFTSSKVSQMNFNDDGPTSLPYSLLPLRDSPSLISPSTGGGGIINSISNAVESKRNNNNSYNNSGLFLNLNAPNTSPSRSSRAFEKIKKDQPNPWPSGSKPKTMMFSQTLDEDDNQALASLLGDIMTSTSLTPHVKNNDPVRHPYAISLDRTKELSRDLLKENKENSRDLTRDVLKDPLGLKGRAPETQRRNRPDMSGWARPRLLNDDLSLPNVPGAANSAVIGSPKKTSSMEASGTLSHGWSKPRKIIGVAPMPVLSAIQRSSATSSERSPPTSPMSCLPNV